MDALKSTANKFVHKITDNSYAPGSLDNVLKHLVNPEENNLWRTLRSELNLLMNFLGEIGVEEQEIATYERLTTLSLQKCENDMLTMGKGNHTKEVSLDIGQKKYLLCYFRYLFMHCLNLMCKLEMSLIAKI